MTPSLPARLLTALCILLPAARAERWQMQYFHDEERSELTITDLTFPSAQRGVAVGYLAAKQRTRGVAVVTSDGGRHWALVNLPDNGLSVFFLDDSTGWAVTPKGILQTEESGRSWRKIPKSPKDVLRVWFLSPQHGYAIGFRKSVWETIDGGKSWARLAAADQAKSTPEYTVYNTIFFSGPAGVITGWSRPPRWDDDELPDWVQPERAARRREWPTVSISIETHDGGRNWRPTTTSLFGEITRVQLAPDGRALGLVEFRNSFPYPSEVFAFNWKGGANERAYREKDRAVTDVALTPSGPAFLATVEVPGKLLRPPIPSRLRLLRSDDLKKWTEMEVDYRANAQRAFLAAVDAQNVWVATDTGMILRLVP